MSTKEIFVIVLSVIAICLLALAIYLYLKAKQRLEKATARVVGRVVDYKNEMGDYKVPIVKYSVNNTDYYQHRIFAGHEYTSDHDVKENKAHLTEDDVLRIRNSKQALKSIEALFPRTSTQNVYYNPQNPQESYVEKFSPMYTKAYVPGLFGLCFIAAAIITYIFV